MSDWEREERLAARDVLAAGDEPEGMSRAERRLDELEAERWAAERRRRAVRRVDGWDRVPRS